MILQTCLPTKAGTEDKWYKYWLDNGLFHSEPNDKPPFTIAIPPPIVLQAVITV
jgi:valyl-tRNA synthetase